MRFVKSEEKTLSGFIWDLNLKHSHITFKISKNTFKYISKDGL